MTEHILTHIENRVLRISLNRPERKNALTLQMYTDMVKALRDSYDDKNIRSIMITGSEDCFTSGNDLQDFVNNPPGDDSPVLQFMSALYHCPKPVVAVIRGAAIGIGTTLLLHCDLAYANENAKFQLPFANLGLSPEFASSLLLPQLIGSAKAAELLMLGEFFDSTTAENLGLINKKVADTEIMSFATERCEKLAQQPPASIRATKQLMKENQRDLGEKVMRKEFSLFADGLQSAEFKEAVNAFFEKRPANFSDFD